MNGKNVIDYGKNQFLGQIVVVIEFYMCLHQTSITVLLAHVENKMEKRMIYSVNEDVE